MADGNDRPLTDEERAELEALRAEKARRERAELEELRAEQRSARVTAPREAAPREPHRPPARPSAPADPAAPAPEDRTFGQRMVLSSGEDEDGMPTMPPAQKIIIAVCLIGVLGFIAYIALSNAGMI